MYGKFRPQPLKTFLEPVRRANPAARTLPRTYVNCTVGKPPGVSSDTRRAQEEGARIREVNAPHMAPFTHPRLVADLLIEIAEDRAP
jgi:hypothetical protein